MEWNREGWWWKQAVSCPAMQYRTSFQCLLAITQVHPCQKQPLLADTDQNSHPPVQ